MTDKTPSEILREAAEYIGEHGWRQNGYRDEEGRVCAMGAIGMVTGCLVYNATGWHWEDRENGSVGEVITRLSKSIHDPFVTGEFGWHIPGWNDSPNTTAEDVILAMKRAAEETP